MVQNHEKTIKQKIKVFSMRYHQSVKNEKNNGRQTMKNAMFLKNHGRQWKNTKKKIKQHGQKDD